MINIKNIRIENVVLTVILIFYTGIPKMPKTMAFQEGQRYNRTFPFDLMEAMSNAADNIFSECFDVMSLCIRGELEIPVCAISKEGEHKMFTNFCELSYQNCINLGQEQWVYVRDYNCNRIMVKEDYVLKDVDVPFILNPWITTSEEDNDTNATNTTRKRPKNSRKEVINKS